MYHVQGYGPGNTVFDCNRYIEQLTTSTSSQSSGNNGKTYLHVAVEHKQKQIISYLLFDVKADPNILTQDTLLAPLHLAVRVQSSEIIELLLTCDKTQIDIYSSLHGTPLHEACRGDSVKIVQQLLLNNSDFTIRNEKSKLPKEITKNQRIIYLIEKYEKKQVKSSSNSFVSTNSQEEEKFEQSQMQQDKRINLAAQGKMPVLDSIAEEDEESIEKQAGSVLDQAEEYIQDFQTSRIELVSTIKGYLLAQGSLKKKQKLWYFVLRPCQGQLLKFEKKDHYEKFIQQDFNIQRARSKLNMEVVDFHHVLSIYPSFRGEFIGKNQHCIEMHCLNE